MTEPVRLRVVSDGSVSGTHVYVGGEKLSAVQSVAYYFAIGETKPTVTITVKHAEVELDVPEGVIVTDPPA
jgi:hypothetical protein